MISIKNSLGLCKYLCKEVLDLTGVPWTEGVAAACRAPLLLTQNGVVADVLGRNDEVQAAKTAEAKAKASPCELIAKNFGIAR